MPTCTVRWRPSGGRGEFEYVPANTLEDKALSVFFEALNLTIPAEVTGRKLQGKPRLRKVDSDNRDKLHLPQLVMAVARLPEPGRAKKSDTVSFPLENKAFVMDAMHFEIIEEDEGSASLAPLRVSILNSDFEINLQDRLAAIAADLEAIHQIQQKHPSLAEAVRRHAEEFGKAVNSRSIRKAADDAIRLQAQIFGMTNAGSARTLEQYSEKPETELEEDITGKEGRLLTRIHVYKERDKEFARLSKKHYKKMNQGRLVCVACDLDPIEKYGVEGERCIEAHHTIPIEELQPDSITRVEEMAMVCASCHRVIHSKKPCLRIEEVRAVISTAGAATA